MSGRNGSASKERARAAVADAPVPPQNLDAEEHVLGAILFADPAARALLAAAEWLEPGDFYRPSHGLIFGAALALHARGAPVDAITLVDELEEQRALEDAGGRNRIHELAALAPPTANVAHHARFVREAAQLRELIRTGGEISRLGWDPGGDTAAKVVRARELLATALDAREPEAAGCWLRSAADLLAQGDPGETPFLVDRLIVDGAFAFLVGKWKVGKTWALLELLLAIATGRPAFGVFDVSRPGPAILILEESGEAAFHRRLDRLVRGYAIDKGQLGELHYATNLGVRLNEPRWQKRLLDAAAALEPRAIMLDPWVRVKGAQTDEKEQREVALVLDYLLGLRERVGAAIIVAAHEGHEGRHIRGSSDLEAVWESRLSLKRDAKSHEVTLAAEHREADELVDFRYLPVFDGATRTVRMQSLDRPDIEGDGERASEDQEAAKIVRWIAENGSSSKNDVWKGVGGRKADVLRRIDRLHDAKRLDCSGGRYNVARDRFPADGNHLGTAAGGLPAQVVPERPLSPVGGGARGTAGGAVVPEAVPAFIGDEP